MPNTFSFFGSRQPLNAHIQNYLQQLCEEIPEDEIGALREKLEIYLASVRKALSQNEFLDVTLAEQIAQRLHLLLNDYGRYSTYHQALLVGTVRYFIKDDDAEHDMHSILGLDDDAAVLNYFCDTVERPDLKIVL